MSNRYWLHIAAVGGFLVLAAIGFLGLTNHKEACKSPGPKQRPSYTESAPRAEAGNPDVFERMARSLEGINRASDPPDKTQREIDDLNAQQDMACWGFWLLVVSGAQVVIGLGGIIALVVTIKQGRASLRIAREANTITHRNAQQELRAYVAVVGAPTDRLPNFDKVLRFHGALHIKNFGNTPAYNVSWRYKCKVIVDDDLAAYDWSIEEPEPRDAVLQPGQFRTIPVSFDEPGNPNPQTTTPELYNAIINKTAKVWIWGVAKYGDAFGKPHTSNFRYLIGYFQLRDRGYGLAPQGNSAD